MQAIAFNGSPPLEPLPAPAFRAGAAGRVSQPAATQLRLAALAARHAPVCARERGPERRERPEAAAARAELAAPDRIRAGREPRTYPRIGERGDGTPRSPADTEGPPSCPRAPLPVTAA